MLLKVICEALLEAALELISAGLGNRVRGDEMDLGCCNPLYDDVHTLAIELLRASELEISEGFLKAFADSDAS